mgnify:CR=1 FL=1
MKMMKKVLALALAGAMALCVLTGCGGGSNAVSTDDLVKALNETGAAKFEVAQNVTVKPAEIQSVQDRINKKLQNHPSYTITDAVELVMAENLTRNLADGGIGAVAEGICAVVEKSSKMSASTLAAQVVKNATLIKVTKTSDGASLSRKNITLDEGGTYDIALVTLDTDKGVCTLVIFY